MAEDWGQAVTDQLWDTSFTWGDILAYEGGAAMLVLFEQGDSGVYHGGFWGVTGEHRGTPVMNFHLNPSSWAGKDVPLSDYYAQEGVAALPNRINSQYRYDYYPRTYVQYSLLAHVAPVNTTVNVGWQVGHKVYQWTGNGITKAVPSWYSWGTAALDIYLAGGVLLEGYTGFSLPGIDTSISAAYPVMAPMREYGMGPTHLGGSIPPSGIGIH